MLPRSLHRLAAYWLCLAASLLAHDLYVMPTQFAATANSTLTVRFHNGDSFPASEVAPRLERLLEPSLHLPGSSLPLQNMRIDGKAAVGDVVLPAGHSLYLLSVHTQPNRIEIVEPSFSKYLKHEGLQHVLAAREKAEVTAEPGRERYSKYSKALVLGDPQAAQKSDALLQQPLGFPIELLLLANPYSLKQGANLPIRLLFRGKPLADAQVEAAWAQGTQSSISAVGRTDSKGELQVPLTKAGQWRLHAIQMEPRTEPDVDWESYWASYTFAVQ